MQRRSFLASILATASVPAFIRSDSLMKLYVPRSLESSILLLQVPFKNGPIYVNAGDIIEVKYTLGGQEGYLHVDVNKMAIYSGVAKDRSGQILLI